MESTKGTGFQADQFQLSIHFEKKSETKTTSGDTEVQDTNKQITLPGPSEGGNYVDSLSGYQQYGQRERIEQQSQSQPVCEANNKKPVQEPKKVGGETGKLVPKPGNYNYTGGNTSYGTGPQNQTLNKEGGWECTIQ